MNLLSSDGTGGCWRRAGGGERERGQDGGHVVPAAGVEREADQRADRAQRVGERGGQGQFGQLGRLGGVVPQAVRAEQQDTGTGWLKPCDVWLRVAEVRADPPG